MSKIRKQRPDEANEPAELGDETGDWSSPRPDQNDVDEIGVEAGVTFMDNEPLRPIEKVEERDRERAELDPASDEDYEDRQRQIREPEED